MNYEKKAYPESNNHENGNSFFDYLDSKESIVDLQDTLSSKTLEELIDEVTTQKLELDEFRTANLQALNNKDE